MTPSGLVARILGFLRAGYPHGVPAPDCFPLLALLQRRVSDDEVVQICTELVRSGELPVDATDIRVMITKLTDQVPSPVEVQRVQEHLVTHGWPSTDEFSPPTNQ